MIELIMLDVIVMWHLDLAFIAVFGLVAEESSPQLYFKTEFKCTGLV